MNQVKLDMQSGAAGRHSLRQQVFLVAAFAALTFLAMMLPMASVQIQPKHYLPLHTLLEFISILAAFIVFSTVWHTPAKEVSASLLLIAVAFFSAGWLDFAHTLSFSGMPDLITPSSAEKSIAFWLVARLLVAATLLGVSFYPQLRPSSARSRYGILAAYTLFNLVVIWGIIFHENKLPDTYTENVGLTQFKRGFEWLITGLFVLTAYRFYRFARRTDDEIFSLIFSAAAIAALSELFFASYVVGNDAHNLLGHLFKFVSYSLIYQAMFVVSARKPYQRLAAQTQTLLKVNEKLRTRSLALTSTAMPVIVTDLQGIVQWRNRAYYALTANISSDFENGLCLFSAPVTPDPKIAASIHEMVRAGKVWRGLVYFKDAQGNGITLDRTVTPLRNEEGEIEGYVSTAENVTKSINAHMRYKRVLDTAIDGFWIADTHGRLLEVNDAYAGMSGYTVEELLRMNMNRLEAVEFTDEVPARMKTIIQQGRGQFESRHLHKQGHEFAVDVSATYDPESQQFFVFFRDRSERVQSAAVKQDLERQLQQSQKMQALGQLTGGIAHDFNNILAAILGYSNLALDRFVPDKQGKLAIYLREVISASERARDLIAKMLTFTRTQPCANAGAISPAAVVQEVAAMMRPSIPASIQLRIRIEDNLPICMDAGELNQILVNLVINARDAIDVHGKIDIHTHRVQINGQICAACQQRFSGNYLAIEVSDTGSGIPQENMSRLFDPFYTTKEIGKGTGLGLSVVQGILRRSNGHAVIESELGSGSRFQLLFPIAAPAEASSNLQPSTPKPKFGLGQRIWIVDDEPAVARFLGELLEDWGYIVKLFNDPTEALSAFDMQKNDVDLLITDQTMPGLSGVALARQLHRLRPDLPIILCTGYSDEIDQSGFLRQGIRRYFTKPMSATELLKAVADELEQKQTDSSN